MDEPGILHLRRDIAKQTVVAGNDNLGRPAAGLDPQDLELDRQKLRLSLGAFDVCVDALDEGGDDLRSPGMIPAQLLRHVAPELQQAGPDVTRQGPWPLDLRQRSRGLAPPQLELKEPVAGDVIPLGEEEVVFVPCIDVGNTPAVAEDLDGLIQAGVGHLLGAPRADVVWTSKTATSNSNHFANPPRPPLRKGGARESLPPRHFLPPLRRGGRGGSVSPACGQFIGKPLSILVHGASGDFRGWRWLK